MLLLLSSAAIVGGAATGAAAVVKFGPMGALLAPVGGSLTTLLVAMLHTRQHGASGARPKSQTNFG